MRARAVLVSLAAFVAAVPDLPAGAASGFRAVREIRVARVRPRLVYGFRRRIRVPRTPRLDLPLPEPTLPGDGGLPDTGERSPGFDIGPSLPHGFRLTIPVGDRPKPGPPHPLRRFVEVGQALDACWDPPDGAWSAITLRVSFKRDGSVNGVPRVPFVDAADPPGKAAVERSLLDALRSCAPLPFSPSLGAAIAGEIFAIRFTHGTRP